MAAAKMPLKQLFSRFPIVADRKLAEQIIRWKLLYETRDEHPETLNTPLLGVTRIGFFPKDSQELFDMAGVDRRQFKLAITQSTIDPNFHVASDDFNLLTLWLIHNFFISTTIGNDLRNLAIKALFFMLQVKFFSSLMHHYLPYPADQATMELTINSLSDKFDIRQKETSTWKLMMEVKAAELTQPNSLHWQSLHLFGPDKAIIYVLSNIQTGLRNKVKPIMMIYFDNKKKGKAVVSSELTSTDVNGQMIIKELTNSYAGMISSLCNRALNAQQFLKADYISLMHRMIRNCTPDKFRNLLMQFSTMATVQYQKKQMDAMSKDGKLFVGYHILISNLIQTTYRRCIMEKVNLNSRYKILEKAMEIYRSSRINDPLIMQVRDSIQTFVEGCKISQREATNSSLRIGFATYIIFLSFDCN